MRLLKKITIVEPVGSISKRAQEGNLSSYSNVVGTYWSLKNAATKIMLHDVCYFSGERRKKIVTMKFFLLSASDFFHKRFILMSSKQGS